MPCLNEAETLARCIEKAQVGVEDSGGLAEIIIADNGSKDDSVQIAKRLGGAFCSCKRKRLRQRVAWRNSSRIGKMDCHGATPTRATTFQKPADSLRSCKKVLNWSTVVGCRKAAAKFCGRDTVLTSLAGQPALLAHGAAYVRGPYSRCLLRSAWVHAGSCTIDWNFNVTEWNSPLK